MTVSVKRVLIADDDVEFLDLLSAWLEGEGIEALIAHDGVEACDLADREPLDLVLLDLLLPRRDGYGVLLHLRAGTRTRSLPVLVVSGEPPAEHNTIAPALGADGFLGKPFGRAELLAAMQSAVAAGKRRSAT